MLGRPPQSTTTIIPAHQEPSSLPSAASISPIVASAGDILPLSVTATCTTSHSSRVTNWIEPSLPFIDEEDSIVLSKSVPAAALVKPSRLPDTYLFLGVDCCTGFKGAAIFTDKKLPIPESVLKENKIFNVDYFVTLHKITSAQSSYFPAGTPNHLGARMDTPTTHWTKHRQVEVSPCGIS